MSKQFKLLLGFGLVIVGFSLIAMKRGREEEEFTEEKKTRPSMASLAGLPEEIKFNMIAQEAAAAPTLRARLAAIAPFKTINKDFYRLTQVVEDDLFRNLIMPYDEYTIKNVFDVSKETLLADSELLREKVIDAMQTISSGSYQTIFERAISFPTDRFSFPLDKAAETDTFTSNNGIIFLLLQLGIDPNTPVNSEPAIFHVLEYNKNPEVVRALFNAGARTDVISYDGRTPLIQELLEGTPESVALVLEYDKNPSSKLSSLRGPSALHVAAEVGDTESAQLLLNAGVDINIKDDDGNTPLHLASLENEKEMVKFLLKKGADPNALNNANQTARDSTFYAEIRAILTEAMSE